MISPARVPITCLAWIFSFSREISSTLVRMVQTKNVSSSGGGDDEDPPHPLRQVKGKTIYLEQQEDKKKCHMERAAHAALAATVEVEQAERGGQLQISSDQIAYRVLRLASRPRSTAPSTPSSIVSTPPPTSPAPVAPEPSTTSSIPTTSTTLAPTVPPLAPISAPPIPPPHFREHDESEVRPIAPDPRLLDLQRATATWVHRFRHVPVESWLPAQRDPTAAPLFSSRT
jgi:hypothetical protein